MVKNNPFDEKDREAETAGDNAPIALPVNNETPQMSEAKKTGFDRTLWLNTGGILLFACCGILLIAYLFTRTSTYKNIFNYPPTPLPTPNMPATQAAWVKPSELPTLGSAAEARRAFRAEDTLYLESLGTYYPLIPDINQPGDVYWHAVELDVSRPVVWSYFRCTQTKKILDENFAQMQVEFFMNEESVPQRFIAVVDYQYQPWNDFFCRALVILVEKWPEGNHLLESQVTFLKPTHDGWNLYPAGTHTFKYFVSVQP